MIQTGRTYQANIAPGPWGTGTSGTLGTLCDMPEKHILLKEIYPFTT
jgi:hypothetical protein